MRTVNRNAVPCPAVLAPAATVAHVLAYSKAANTKGVNSTVYGDETVVAALHRLYLGKCSLCEADAKKDGLVEHFIPHHPQRAALAYEWTNLHWTCSKCNQRKRKDTFKEYRPGTRVVERTLLIDPSNPGAVPVESMMAFDHELSARPTQTHQADPVVSKTVDFLNDSIPHTDRLTTCKVMHHLLVEWSCVPEWKALLAANPINPAVRPDPIFSRDALSYADRLYLFYLDVAAPFCTSMRCVIAELGLSALDIARLGREHRTIAGIPQLY